MKNFKSPLGLNPGGSGPKIVRRTLPFIILSIIASVYFPEIVRLPVSNVEILKTSGWVWSISGLVIWITAVVQFARSFPKGNLVTNGVFALSRNPIYASYIVFVLPMLSLICNNRGFFASALVM